MGRYGEIWACRRRRSSCLGRCGEMWGETGLLQEAKQLLAPPPEAELLAGRRLVQGGEGGAHQDGRYGGDMGRYGEIASCRKGREAPIRTPTKATMIHISCCVVRPNSQSIHSELTVTDGDPHQLLCGQAPAERAAARGAVVAERDDSVREHVDRVPDQVGGGDERACVPRAPT